MAQKKTIDAKEFYLDSFDDYLNNLHTLRPNVERPMIIKPTISEEQALRVVEAAIDSRKKTDPLVKLVVKKGVKPTVKKVYQNVLVTFFTTSEAEYDYTYSLNGESIHINPKRIAINEGYAEFTAATQIFTGTGDLNSHDWPNVTKDMLCDDVDKGYVFAKLNQDDLQRDSKASMRQYNKQLKDWLIKYQQKELGKARVVTDVKIYDKEYDYDEAVLIAPFILVSYDLGDKIVTFSVKAFTGTLDEVLLNNPSARFEYVPDAAGAKFSLPLFLGAAIIVPFFGGVLYLMWYFKNNMSKSKQCVTYSVSELKKLL